MKFGLVGTGAMTRRFLAAVEGKVSGVTFVAAYSPTASRLNSFAREYPHIRCLGEYSSLLSGSEVDAVYIATPVATHAHLTIEAARAQKHILCEKPMALTAQECQAMVEAARGNAVTLQIGYMMRFHPAHQRIVELIRSGALGKIQFVHLERTAFADFKSPDFPSHRKWFVDQSQSGGGAFMDLGSHLIDLLLYFLEDEVIECKLFASVDEDLGVELGGLASLLFKNGSLATVFAGWQTPLHDNLLQVYGERASIQASRTIGPYTDGQVTLFEGGRRTILEVPYQNHYVREVEHFLECVQMKREPLTSGANSLPTEKLRMRLYASRIQD